MTTGKYVLIGAGVVLLVVALLIGGMWVSYNNQEIRLRNTINAKSVDNRQEMDNMWKKISQAAQVTDAQKNALKEIFVAHAEARGGVSKGGANPLMTWLQESVPHVDTTTFNNLQNIITASRDSWTMRQKELLDLSREHNNALTLWPSSLFVGGRGKIDVTIITSSRTEETFKTGKDDDVNVFPGKR